MSASHDFLSFRSCLERKGRWYINVYTINMYIHIHVYYVYKYTCIHVFVYLSIDERISRFPEISPMFEEEGQMVYIRIYNKYVYTYTCILCLQVYMYTCMYVSIYI